MKFSIVKFKIFVGLSYFLLVSHNSYACKSVMNSLQQSKFYIEFILSDVVNSTKQLTGGGISEISKISDTIYRVSIPQNEKMDEITYELELNSMCAIKIKKRTKVSRPVKG